MRHKILKGTTTMLALAFMASSFAACGGGKVVDEIDHTKTALFISAYEAGYGTDWLVKFAADFEEFYKDQSFEEGKTGVDVRIDWNQENHSALLTQMPISGNALYFNSVNYYELVNSGYALNFNDIVKTPMTEFGEADTTLEDKIPDQLKEYYQAFDGNYYAAPAYETYEGIQYDVSLFEEKKFYFAETDGQWTSGLEGDLPKSAGPDGEKGTYDDGFPATYDEFFKLCDHMYNKNVIPFVWPGGVKYADMLTQALWVNFEGKDQMMLNFTFDGTATDLVDVSNGVVTPLGDTKIDTTNGHLLTKQEGIYRALEFAEKLARNSKYYYSESFSNSLDHVGSQERYLYSRFDEKSKPIAMMIEGTYWQTEAKSIFASVNSKYALNDEYSFENRRYGFMPLPHYNDAQAQKNGRKNTILGGNVFCFGNNTVSDVQKLLAGKFVQFISTNDKVYEFYKDNHYSKGLNVEFTPEQLDSLSAYARSQYDTMRNANVIYGASDSKFWMKYSASFLDFKRGNDGRVFNASASLRYPIYSFGDANNASLTPEQYFNMMHSTLQNKWKSE